MGKRKKQIPIFSQTSQPDEDHYIVNDTAFDSDLHHVESQHTLPCSPKKQPSAPTTQHRQQAFFEGTPDEPEHIHQDFTGEDEDQQPDKAESKKKRERDPALLPFFDKLDEITLEWLRLESLTPNPRCASAQCGVSLGGEGPTPYRCEGCGSVLFCRDCLLREHLLHPFHFVQEWNGSFFQRITLKSLNFRYQLNHPPGQKCPFPRSAHNNDFTVYDVSGIHSVGLDYCGCAHAPSHFVQLLRARLFPASTVDPKTAGTFQCLKLFQMLSFVSKVSGWEFVRALSRLTDNTGTVEIHDRYEVFMRMVHVWRHTRSLKRAGRGHAPSGAKGTAQGELAVLCPACPYEGINLDPNWRALPVTLWFLFALFIAIDANFRLKRKLVSSDYADPGFNRGFAYVVEEKSFRWWLDKHGDIVEEPSTCNSHDAIKSAGIRGGRGWAASGMGMAQCSRHDMKLPTGAGDLQKGEKYINMDFFFLSAIAHFTTALLIISYDIACQWSRYLTKRCKTDYPPNAVSVHNPQMRFFVPKFHLPAHVPACQTQYSLNLLPGVGRTDGEAPERGWSSSNDLAYSTRAMGPGNRRDTIDDAFGDWNWAKSCQIANVLLARAKIAIEERTRLRLCFEELHAALDAKITKPWEAMVTAWEADQSQPNPFELPPQEYKELSALRKELAMEDAADVGSTEMVHNDISPSQFIYQGLEIEDSQRRLALKSKEKNKTDLQKTHVVEQGNALARKVAAWIEVQNLYMPLVAPHRRRLEEAEGDEIEVHAISLFLPSHAASKGITCSRRLVRCEFQLRLSSAQATLNELRGALLQRSRLLQSKKKYASGTVHMTRSNRLIQDVYARVDNLSKKYKVVRGALQTLGGILGEERWSQVYLPLTDADVKGPTAMDTEIWGEGKKALTWIWRVQGMGKDASHDKELTVCTLRVEWCRARARSHRWQEECMLLSEEIRRTVEFFKWKGASWKAKGSIDISSAGVDDPAIVQGRIAYAEKQSHMWNSMADNARAVYDDIRSSLDERQS